MSFSKTFPKAMSLLLFGLMNCSHAPANHAEVVMKVSDTDVHIGLGSSDGIKPGDQVSFFDQVCTRPSLQQEGVVEDPVCERTKIGEGAVLRVLGERYSVVQIPSDSKIKEGTEVEKMNPRVG